MTFADLGVSPRLVEALASQGITTPFEVQVGAMPPLFAGSDLCARAPTGSGKTLAFGIPLVSRVGIAQPRRPRALVLAPTRELAQQIDGVLAPLAALCGRKLLAVYGGVSLAVQRDAIAAGIDVLVATPGRLGDLVKQGAVDLSAVTAVVIDEADRMADMGFLDQVRRLLDRTAAERQMSLFSATLDGDVAELTRDYQRDPVRIEVGHANPDQDATRHVFWRVEPGSKVKLAVEVVRAHHPAIVFCRTRHGVDALAKTLREQGVHAAPLHGGRTQGRRDRALENLLQRNILALVATDVAARGLHVDDLGLVLHYDPPADAKAYVHRSGRTARAGATGLVLSFVTGPQVKELRVMQEEMGLPVGTERPDKAALGARRAAPEPRPKQKQEAKQAAKKKDGPKKGEQQGRRTKRPGSGKPPRRRR